jgi:multidrug resistance efflux pump
VTHTEPVIRVEANYPREAETRTRSPSGRHVDLDKTVVKAPIDGAILKVNVRLGDYAQAGVLAEPLMTMGSVDPLHVQVDIDETETCRVRPGH